MFNSEYQPKYLYRKPYAHIIYIYINFHLILIIMNDGYVYVNLALHYDGKSHTGANTEHNLLNPKTTEYYSLLYLNHIQMLYSITGEERINKITLKWRHNDVTVLYCTKNVSLLVFFSTG